ncbi:MAG TPA: hypothetical protein VGG28_09945 [Kofleriaceae bacterium]|jgi:hypothetical protein
MRAALPLIALVTACSHSNTTCGTQGPASLFENPCDDAASGVCLLDHAPTGFF